MYVYVVFRIFMRVMDWPGCLKDDMSIVECSVFFVVAHCTIMAVNMELVANAQIIWDAVYMKGSLHPVSCLSIVCIMSVFIYRDMQLGPDGSVAICARCNEGFGSTDKIVNSGGEVWHPRCFVWVWDLLSYNIQNFVFIPLHAQTTNRVLLVQPFTAFYLDNEHMPIDWHSADSPCASPE